MAKPGVMLYFEMLEPLGELSLEEKGMLLDAILQYGKNQVTPKFTGMLGLAWGFIRPKLDKDAQNYSDKVLQRKYAAYCRKQGQLGLGKLSFEDWQAELEQNPDNENEFSITDDASRSTKNNENPFSLTDDAFRYPTTTTTTIPTTTAPTTTTTTTIPKSTTITATTAAAITGAADAAQIEAAAAEQGMCVNDYVRLRIINGDVGKGVIKLSPYQVDRLLQQIGVDNFDYYVARLADFITEKRATVRNHYETILSWYDEDSKAVEESRYRLEE